MAKKLLYFFLTITLAAFGQNSMSPEDKIYNSIDVFVSNPSLKNIKKLESVEADFWKNPKPKTKNELLALVILNCNKGYYFSLFGETNQAISSYEKSWQIFNKNKLSNYDIIEYCLKPLGNLYTIIGDYDNAENTIKQYYFIANKEQNQSQASEQKTAAILNLSNVYQNTGRINEAIDLLEKTIKTEQLTSVQRGNLYNNLGNNYVLKYQQNRFNKLNSSALKKLEDTYFTAIKLLQSEKSQSETLANCYRNLSALYLQSKNLELANSYFEKAKKYFFNLPNISLRKQCQFKYEEANLLFHQKKYTDATALVSSIFKTLIPNYSNQKNSLPNPNSLYAETILLDALDLQAVLFLEQNQPKKALEGYTLSFKIEDLFANLLVYENSKIINQIRIRNRTEKCIRIYHLLFQQEHKIEYIEHAFQLSEQSKSGVLKNTLFIKKTASKEEKKYLEQLQNWNNEILKEQQKNDLANVSKINEALFKQNQLMISLKKIRSKNRKNSAEKIDLKSLFSKLEKDKGIMVAYFSGLENMYSFTLNNNQIKMQVYEGSANSNTKIDSFLKYFTDSNAIINDTKGYNEQGYNLYNYLNIPHETSCQNLIIVPDGLLHFVPFEALIIKKSNTQNFAQMHYLLNDFRIAYTNSASFYLYTKPIPSNKKIVLGIFPVFEKTEYELTFSKDEMHSIKNNFDGLFLKNEKATFQNFKTNAPNYSIVHLSTHASSGTVETPASIKFYDQEILYSELYNLKINPELVVLSACETGVGKLYKSEGAMSIARGFQFAGAQNLLFSLWKVNDYTTSVFMANFYKNIKKKESYFEANANAKLEFLKDKTISNSKKSPYYWSAFVYYGGIETEEKSTNCTIYIYGLFVVIGLFLGFKAFKK